MILKIFIIICSIFISSTYNLESFRLPKSILPDHYDLEIFTNLEETFDEKYEPFSFFGSVKILASVAHPTKKITLHFEDLEIDKKLVKVKNQKTKEDFSILDQSYEPDNDFYIIELKNELKPQTMLEVFLPFTGKLTASLAGYYLSSYSDKSTNETKWMTITHFEPTDARRAFPCFDEPDMKAEYTIKLVHSDKYTSISNMPLEQTEKLSSKLGWVRDHYEKSLKMSTYLVAYSVNEFGYKMSPASNLNNNVTFRIWTRKDALNQVDFAASYGPKYLDFFEQFYKVKYPLQKQDMIALPDLYLSGMENWGLITYRETALLYDPETSSPLSQAKIAELMAHELAHQWFGNLVTMKWWTDLWLKEGFATYMSMIAVEALNPEWNSLKNEVRFSLQTVFSVDALNSSHPVSVPIGHPSEISQIFDIVSYYKGSLVLRMIDHFLGTDAFREGITNYLTEYKYSNADTDDLWKALTDEAHKQKTLPENMTIKTIMDTWTQQTGYPIINVKRDNNTLVISQKRFVIDESINRQSKESPCWWIPITYTTAREKNFTNTIPKEWISCENGQSSPLTIKLPREDEWIVFNLQVATPYRINYDEKNWKLITEALLDDPSTFPILNKVQFILDSLELARTGELDYDVPLRLLSYLEKETEYLPWKSAIDGLGKINSLLKRTPKYGYFLKFARSLISSVYEQYGDIKKSYAKQVSDDVRFQILISSSACILDVGQCGEYASEIFKQWMEEPQKPNPVPSNLRSVVYCKALALGNDEEWEFLWQQYLKSNLAFEKSVILEALGCTKRTWLLNRYLEWSITPNSGIRQQDMTYAFSSVVTNEIGFNLAYNFFKRDIKRIDNYLGIKKVTLGRLLKTLANHISLEDQFEDISEFIKENSKYFKELELNKKQALETMRLNVLWYNKIYGSVERTFKALKK